MHEEILKFWFEDIEPKMHYTKDEAFDALLREKFGDIHTRAAASELTSWRENS